LVCQTVARRSAQGVLNAKAAPLPQRRRQPASLGRWRWLLRGTALALGALQAYAGRNYLNADGVSYLDLAGALAAGDAQAALNPYWSPLLPGVLAVGLALLRPGAYWECAAAKLVGFALYAGALAAFEWLLTELLRWRRSRPRAAEGLPDRTVVLLAYPLFLVTSLGLISLVRITPDMLVAGLVYLAAALVTRGQRLGLRPGRSVLLGLVLGAGYLAKSSLLPLGLVFLAASAWAAGSWRRALAHLAAGSAAMALVVTAFAVPLSLHEDRPTLGEAGRLNYLWFVNGVELFRWRTTDSDLGTPAHPPRMLPSDPPVYEFAEPVGGTYPLWYDPAYWCEGLHQRWSLADQWQALRTTGSELLALVLVKCGVFTAVLAILSVLAWSAVRREPRGGRRALAAGPPLLLPALAAFALYALVHVQGRYLAPFLTLLFLGLLVRLRFRLRLVAQSAHYLPFLIVLTWAPVAALALESGMGSAAGEGEAAHRDAAVAEELARQGVLPGSRVAVLGDAFECGWARPGRLRIVAQVERQDAPRYWTADARHRQAVLDAFRRAGAVAVVAPDAPADGGGVAVPRTTVRVFPLPPAATAVPAGRGE
jgi:hypothetical protein